MFLGESSIVMDMDISYVLYVYSVWRPGPPHHYLYYYALVYNKLHPKL